MKIEFEDKGKKICLEYTRETSALIQKNGFEVSKMRSQDLIMLPMLFRGAFLAHHKGMKTDEIDSIFKRFKKKSELWETLLEMFREPSETLFEEPEGDEGNIDWTADR